MKPLARRKSSVSDGYSGLLYSQQKLTGGDFVIPILENKKLTLRKRFSNLPKITWLSLRKEGRTEGREGAGGGGRSSGARFPAQMCQMPEPRRLTTDTQINTQV